jgi:hypothetical protein
LKERMICLGAMMLTLKIGCCEAEAEAFEAVRCWFMIYDPSYHFPGVATAPKVHI